MPSLKEGGLIADRYRLAEKIGAGGMAVVWLARDERLGRNVAVKIISDSLAEDDAFRRRFRREAETAASLSHPNLVTVHDVGDVDGRPFLVMEHIEGKTLAQTAAQGKLGPDAGERLAGELLGALGAAHAAGVIHRDVKPANVLIDPVGHAHLTDFGIARSGDATQLTQAGMAIGTLEYMAPEVKAGAPADERSDLYSLGILLASTVRDSERGALGGLIDRLTEQEPDDRPSDATTASRLIGAAGAVALGAPAAEAAADVPETEVLPADQAPTVQDDRTAATRPMTMAGGPRSNGGSRRALALAALAAAIVALFLIASAGGDDGGGGTDDTLPQPEATTEPDPVPETTTPPSDTSTAPPLPATEEEPSEEGEADEDEAPGNSEGKGHGKQNGKGKGKGGGHDD